MTGSWLAPAHVRSWNAPDLILRPVSIRSSVRVNDELDAVIEDPALGVAAEAMFMEDLQQSRELRAPNRLFITGERRLETGDGAGTKRL